MFGSSESGDRDLGTHAFLSDLVIFAIAMPDELHDLMLQSGFGRLPGGFHMLRGTVWDCRATTVALWEW